MRRALLAILLWIMEGEEGMVAVYIALILAGRRTFEQVPQAIRRQVGEELAALGLPELAG